MSSQSSAARITDPEGGIKPQRGKKVKPVVVEYKFINPPLPEYGDWGRYGRYKDVETALQVIAQQNRKYSWAEYRIKP